MQISKKDPNIEKVKEKLERKTLQNKSKDKKRFQRIRAAIKRNK